MNKFLFIILTVLAVFASTARAQYEGMDLDQRIGGSEEHIKEVRGWLSLFQQSYQDQQWSEAYPFWKMIVYDSPVCNLGVYANGAYMLAQLIDAESDEAQKLTYFKDLMWLYDTRLKNLTALNSWQTREKNKATEGDVLVLQAYYYSAYAPKADKDGYSLTKAYELFNTGIESVRTKGGRDVPYYALDTYMRVSQALYKNNPELYREQFLQDYLSCREVCETMLEYAKEEEDQAKAQKIVNDYDPVLQLCDALFAESGAGDRDQIVAIFTPKVEQNKTDINYLKKALTIMAENNCDDTDIYYQAAEYAYQIEPTYESAIGTAQKLSLDGRHNEAADRYNKAIELCSSDKTRGQIAIKVATAMSKSKNFDQAYKFLDKAVSYNPDLTGRCSYMRAQYLTRQEKYDNAIAACDQAMAEDITLQGPAQRLKEQITNVKAQIADYNKKKAEYDAAKRKQQEEEDFWNKGKQ